MDKQRMHRTAVTPCPPPARPLPRAQKQYDAFTKELARDGVDPNQPDTKGRLPIYEAVKNKDVQYVDGLIQFGGLVNSKDPATGASPIQQALIQNSIEVGMPWPCLAGGRGGSLAAAPRRRSRCAACPEAD